jgi:hypothetical protein
MRLCLLCRDCASDRVDDVRKPHQHAVAGGLDDAAVVLGDFRVDELAAQHSEAFERAFLSLVENLSFVGPAQRCPFDPDSVICACKR